jgi:hypothetical protein
VELAVAELVVAAGILAIGAVRESVGLGELDLGSVSSPPLYLRARLPLRERLRVFIFFGISINYLYFKTNKYFDNL